MTELTSGLWMGAIYAGFVLVLFIIGLAITLWWEKRHPELYGDEAGKQSP